jgi:ELMO domain-containing protein
MLLINIITQYFHILLNTVLKCIQHFYYGKGELERLLTDSSKHTFLMTDMAGKIILRSKALSSGSIVNTMMLPKPYNVNALAMQIIKLKKIRQNTSSYQILKRNLKLCLSNLNGSRYAISILNNLKSIKYDNTNMKHEEILYKLWQNLMPNMTLPSRVCAEWNEIGFQGTNPETDFRGMGYLGLYILCKFSETDNYYNTGEKARRILKRSKGPIDNPLKFYPFACAGLQITQFALDLMEKRQLDRWFYEIDVNKDSSGAVTSSSTTIGLRERNVTDIFVRLYSDMFELLDVCWEEGKPINVMDFGRIFNDFKSRANRRFCS